MPEGDAVRRTALHLDEALSGRVVTTSDFRVPRYATVDLRGRTVLETVAVGKHLLTRLSGGVTVHSHRRMEGRWVTGGPDRNAGPFHQVRVVIRTASSSAIGLRLAMVEVAPTSAEGRWVGHLGPDVLADDFDAGIELPAERPIVETLLDQRVIAGLGTMWAAETAFLAGCSPYACDVDISDALTHVRVLMLASVAGSRPRMNVFERAGQPCRVCGTGIRTGRVGTPPSDRITYWCPRCQP